MLILVTGPRASGKDSVANFLKTQGFKRLHLENPLSLMAGSRVSVNQLEVGRLTVSELETPLHTPASEPMDLDQTTFKDAEAMLDYTTPRWREPFVTTDLVDISEIEKCDKRPWFMVAHVDAPRISRWKRSNGKRAAAGEPAQDLEEFIAEDDQLLFGSGQTMMVAMPSGVPAERPLLTDYTLAAKLAKLEIINVQRTIESFHSYLRGLQMTDMERLRPSWDTYFMTLAEYAAKRTNCMKRGVGCVIAKARWFVSAGYNGTPKGVKNCHEGGCGRCNGGAPGGTALHTCLCLHAEENALLGVGRERTEGATLYCNTCPCTPCAVKIIQAGITEVVYSKSYALDIATELVFTQAGVKLRQYLPRP